MVFIKRLIILLGALAIATVIGLMIWAITNGGTLGFLSALGIGLFFVSILTM